MFNRSWLGMVDCHVCFLSAWFEMSSVLIPSLAWTLWFYGTKIKLWSLPLCPKSSVTSIALGKSVDQPVLYLLFLILYSGSYISNSFVWWLTGLNKWICKQSGAIAIVSSQDCTLVVLFCQQQFPPKLKNIHTQYQLKVSSARLSILPFKIYLSL